MASSPAARDQVVAESVCFTLARVAPKLRPRRDPATDRSSIQSAHLEWLDDTTADHYEDSMTQLGVRGADVLDLGRGCGGRLPFLTGLESRSVLAGDINAGELDIAGHNTRRFFPELADPISYGRSNDGSVPAPASAEPAQTDAASQSSGENSLLDELFHSYLAVTLVRE